MSGVREKIRLAFRWFTITALGALAILAAAFWTMIFGGFAESGFRAGKPLNAMPADMPITAECAWPYAVDHPEARSVCRIFFHLTPEQRQQVLAARQGR